MNIGSKVTIIDVDEWDNLVMQTYGKVYNFQQQDGCQERKTVHLTIPDQAYDYQNDSIPEVVNGDKMGVSFKAWLERDPKQRLNTDDQWDREHGLNLFWERNFYPELQTVANDLYNKGILEAGEYGINIDW